MPNAKSGTGRREESAGRPGGVALYEKYGAEHMRRIGAKGTATIQERYGLRYYSEIARRRRGSKRSEKESGAA